MPVAKEVPLPRRYGADSVDGNCVAIADPGAFNEITCAPGATRSGLASPSAAVGPWALKFGSSSSPRPLVPRSSIAPTVTTYGSSPGLVIVPGAGPRFDAATTTTSPDDHACSTA